jgi:perosamine synthetase
MTSTSETTTDIIHSWGVYVPEDAAAAVADVLKSPWLNTGRQERLLRETFCATFGSPFAVATSNGTASLRAALAMLGVGPGDEVISTPMTFIATNTAILEQGAVPVFADIRYGDFNIDPESVRARITPKTKAIICVHYAGNPCDMDALWAIGREHNLPVIEDSAHALGSKYHGHYIGSRGDLACFSFQVVKIITCGDGGMITTTRPDYYASLKKYIWYGVDREGRTPGVDAIPGDIDVLGFKYNMNDITATLALAGLRHIEVPLARRRIIGERYRRELSDCRRIRLVEYYPDRTPNYQILPVHVDDRARFADWMWSRGIQVVANNRRSDRYSIMGGLRDLPVTERADRDAILLPIHFHLSDADQDRVIDAVRHYDRS